MSNVNDISKIIGTGRWKTDKNFQLTLKRLDPKKEADITFLTDNVSKVIYLPGSEEIVKKPDYQFVFSGHIKHSTSDFNWSATSEINDFAPYFNFSDNNIVGINNWDIHVIEYVDGKKCAQGDFPGGIENFNQTTASSVPIFSDVFSGGMQPVSKDQHDLQFWFNPKKCNS